MSIYRFIDLDCDGPFNRGCPYDNKIQADSVAVARADAKEDGWIKGNLGSGVWIDLCSLCKKEKK